MIKLLASLLTLSAAPALALGHDGIEEAYARAQRAAAAVPCAQVELVEYSVWSMLGGKEYSLLSRQLTPGHRLAGKIETPRGHDSKSFDGELAQADYDALVAAANTAQFWALQPDYRVAGAKDGTVRTITVTCADGRKKSVSDNGEAGPAPLVSLERRLQKALDAVFWVD